MTQTSSQLQEGGFELEGCSAAFLNLDKEGNCLGDLLSCAILKQLFKYLCTPHSFQEDACTYRTSSPSALVHRNRFSSDHTFLVTQAIAGTQLSPDNQGACQEG